MLIDGKLPPVNVLVEPCHGPNRNLWPGGLKQHGRRVREKYHAEIALAAQPQGKRIRQQFRCATRGNATQ